MKRKKDGKGGIASWILSIAAVIVGFSMMSTTQDLMTKLKDEVVKSAGEKYQVTRKYVDMAETDKGVIGFMNSMLGNVKEEDKAQLEKELNDWSALLNDARDGADNPDGEKKEETGSPADAGAETNPEETGDGEEKKD